MQCKTNKNQNAQKKNKIEKSDFPHSDTYHDVNIKNYYHNKFFWTQILFCFESFSNSKLKQHLVRGINTFRKIQ